MAARTALLLLHLAKSLSSTSLDFPRPSGPFGTNVVVTGLIDDSRLDPFAPNPENGSTVVSIFYPAAPANECDWKYIPLYPARTAAIFDAEVAFAGVPNGTLEHVRLEVCNPQKTSQSWSAPIVLFSPGLGLSRLWYSGLAQAVSSFGFIVVTIDHPYDADVVEFPDGRIIRAINSTWDYRQSLLDVHVRAEDASFVLDELSRANTWHRLLPSQFNFLYNGKPVASRAAIFGHSLGGATAASAMFEDKRFVGGVDLDGGLYGPVIDQGLDNPFLLFGHQSNSTSPTFANIWAKLDWKLDIDIVNSTHTTFTDIPLLAHLIFGQPLPPFVAGIVGGIPGPRARDVVSSYIAAFANTVLKCWPSALLQRPSAEFPEIVFVGAPKP